MLHFFLKLIIVLVLPQVLIQAKRQEKILCVAGRDHQFYFRRPEGLEYIRPCNIIHGSVFIVMMNINSSFVPLSNLTELIGSLNLYSNDHITSLSQLFPNLSVMRLDYPAHNSPKLAQATSPQIHLSSNVMLERINLSKLSYIEGPLHAVPSEDLCYFNTVNWTSIANYPHACHMRTDSRHCWESCSTSCPEWSTGKRYCWSEHTCQYECKCGSVGDSKIFCRLDKRGETGNNCCHINCLGGCYGPSASDCAACKSWTILETGVCTNSTAGCPNGTLELLNKFCVSPEYCKKLESQPGKPYKIHNKKCLALCPPNTNDDPSDPLSCVVCRPENCRRILVANKTIMYMTDFPEYSFTDLVGNLVLNLEELKPSQTVMLEDKLKSLRNITGSLKVYRSERVQGLDMFKSLEEIGRGGCALSNGFCITIHSNEFLQRLWQPTKGKLIVLNGNISIAHNPRLCQNAIDEFRKYLDASVYVHQEGNGARGYCSSLPITPVKILRQRKDESYFTLKVMENFKWSIAVTAAFNLSNTDDLLTLSLYYRKADGKKNLTYYDPAFCDDSPGDSTIWRRHVVSANFSSPEFWIVDSGIKLFVTNITSPGLEPNSRYGIYALAQYMDGRLAISDIYKFHTIVAPPIFDLSSQYFHTSRLKNKTYNSLEVAWPRPKFPNGNVTHYVVRYWQMNNTMDHPKWGCKEMKQRLANRRQRLYAEPSPNAQPIPMYSSMLSEHSFNEVASCGEASTGTQNVNMIIATLFQKQSSSSSSATPDVNTDEYQDMRRRNAISVHDVLGNDYIDLDLTDEYVASAYEHALDASLNSPFHLQRSPRSADDFYDQPVFTALRNADTARCEKTLATVKGKKTPTKTQNANSAVQIVCKPTLTVGNLTHFTKYKFEVSACFDPDPDTGEYLCSEPIYFTEQTAPHPKADIMTADMVTVNSYISTDDGKAHRQLSIKKPELTNGEILYFSLRYRAAGSMEQMEEMPDICIDNDPKSDHVTYALAVHHTKYEAVIAVETLYGLGNYSNYFEFDGIVAKIPLVMSVAIATSLGLLLISAGLLTWYAFVLRRKRSQIAKDGLTTPDWISMNPDYPLLTSIDIPDNLELDRDSIEVLAEIGRGSFGVVYRGLLGCSNSNLSLGLEASRTRSQVAVKSLRCDASIRQRHDFLHEALILAPLDCHHIVRLVGVVSRTQPIYVVMELMDNGDLKSFLVKHRPENIAANVAASASNMPKLAATGNLNTNDFTQMAGEVADGLAYLSARKIVHRDLAARNCLVSRDRTVKLGDFGLARDVYDDNYYHLHGRALLPIRWMAPESLRDGVFDTYSDVWSYGVLLWEIVTLGEQPYQGKSNEEVLEAVKQHRQVLNKPKTCPDKFYNLMLRCWQYKPNERLTFMDIVRELLPGLHPDFLKVSYYGSVTTVSDSSGIPTSSCNTVKSDDSASAVEDEGGLNIHLSDANNIDNNNSDEHVLDDVKTRLLAADDVCIDVISRKRRDSNGSNAKYRNSSNSISKSNNYDIEKRGILDEEKSSVKNRPSPNVYQFSNAL